MRESKNRKINTSPSSSTSQELEKQIRPENHGRGSRVGIMIISKRE